MKNESLIFDIKGSSMDDGPGIRTVVFSKGALFHVSGVIIRKAKVSQQNFHLMWENALAVGTV